MIEILAVCTGNICRSPLAEKVLVSRLSGLDVSVSSAGTRARTGAPMTTEAIELAVERGVPESDAARHEARLLTPSQVMRADLIIALTRTHRRAVVELEPSGLRKTFTAREFARLTVDIRDDEVLAASHGTTAAPGSDAQARMVPANALVARRRGLSLPPRSPDDDDVIDPYGRSIATYARSAEQLDPALVAIERIVRLALLEQ